MSKPILVSKSDPEGSDPPGLQETLRASVTAFFLLLAYGEDRIGKYSKNIQI